MEPVHSAPNQSLPAAGKASNAKPFSNFTTMQCKALFFALCLPLMVNSQNLVPNGSFEDYTSCPDHLDGMEFVEHWYKSVQHPGAPDYENPSPDYFHECASGSGMGVPINFLGFQYPFEGDAYTGLFTYHINWQNEREFMGVELINPLVPGEKYYCSFRYVWAGGLPTGIQTNRLGMKFSNTEFFEDLMSVIDNSAHLYIEEVATDSSEWQLIMGDFIPTQAFSFFAYWKFF